MAIDFETIEFKDDETPCIDAAFLNKLQKQTKSNLENLDNKEVSGEIITKVVRIKIPSGTIITDKYEIMLPLYYTVGNNSLELYWNGVKLTKATDTEDGHYKEIGSTGIESNIIQIHRTEEDGTYTLSEDVILEVLVRDGMGGGAVG